MGCGSSKQREEADPGAILELAPRPVAAHEQPLPQLDRETLVRALSNVAAYLRSQRANITVIVVGGSVNTILLQTRETTHDVDFYNQKLLPKDFNLIKRAVAFAQSKDSRLQEEWFNNRTIFFMDKSVRETLTEQAIAQNETVFQQAGLKVLAAPWPYAICAKLDRVSGAGLHPPKPHDVSDAAAYLNRYLAIKGLKAIGRSVIIEWAQRYQTRVTAPVLGQLADLYRQIYRKEGINLET